MSRPVTAVYNLRTRTLIYLIFLLLLSVLGIALMSASQDRISLATGQITEVLMPAGRMIEEAKNEINLQIQELSLMASLYPSSKSAPQNFIQVRLSPSVRALLTLQSGPMLPGVLAPLFEPWAQAALNYQDQSRGFKSIAQALGALRELRQKTEILHRAVGRELQVQLLSLTNTSRDHLLIGSTAFLLGLLSIILFVYLIWRWMSPLDQMRLWISQNADPQNAPRSVLATGLLAPPAEVQSLIEAMRAHILKFRDQSSELEHRLQKTQETERAMGTLFSALHYLTRHNEELLRELIKKERLASMSEVSAQLAHEIRNPLNSMNLNLELLREELSPPQREILDKVLREMDRLDALTESHLRTTRAHLSSESPLNLRSSVEQLLETLEPEMLREGIKLSFEFAAHEPITTQIPENILRAALINLIKNGREALADSHDKSLYIQISGESSQWQIHVYDRGCGFPKDFMKNPFESFRTTKAEGSGLGLATAQKMLQAFGASLVIESPCGEFSTRVTLKGDTNLRQIGECTP